MYFIAHLSNIAVSLNCTGPKSRQYIPPIRCIEVTPRIPEEARTGRPAAAAQDFTGFKPRFRILFVGVNFKAGIGSEGGAGPLPDVTNHLPAPEGAIAFWTRSHVNATHRTPVEVGVFWRWGFITPREATLPRGESVARWIWLGSGGGFPFGFCGESAICPTAVGFGFIVVDMNDRKM